MAMRKSTSPVVVQNLKSRRAWLGATDSARRLQLLNQSLMPTLSSWRRCSSS